MNSSNSGGRTNDISSALSFPVATVKSLGRCSCRAEICSGFWVMVAENRSFWRGGCGIVMVTGAETGGGCIENITVYIGMGSHEV